MTKQIALSKYGKHRGKYFAIIDDEDFDRVNARNWHAHNFHNGQPRYTYSCLKRSKFINMAQFVLGLNSGEMIDHIDGDGMNNTRGNLRVCTMSKNNANRKMPKNNSTGFKGIVKRHKRYESAIMMNGKKIHIGTFDTPEAAARAYDAKAVELFGEFARLNFPQESKA